MSRDFRFPFRRLADIKAERNASAGKKPPQAHELIFRQRVHGIDDHRTDAGRHPFVPQMQASADDGVEKAFRLAGTGAGGNQRGSPIRDGANGTFLMAIEVRDVLWDALAQQRMEDALLHQRGNAAPLPERAGEADVRAFEQRRATGFVERQ